MAKRTIKRAELPPKKKWPKWDCHYDKTWIQEFQGNPLLSNDDSRAVKRLTAVPMLTIGISKNLVRQSPTLESTLWTRIMHDLSVLSLGSSISMENGPLRLSSYVTLRSQSLSSYSCGFSMTTEGTALLTIESGNILGNMVTC